VPCKCQSPNRSSPRQIWPNGMGLELELPPAVVDRPHGFASSEARSEAEFNEFDCRVVDWRRALGPPATTHKPAVASLGIHLTCARRVAAWCLQTVRFDTTEKPTSNPVIHYYG
jgi:hypothetical protein